MNTLPSVVSDPRGYWQSVADGLDPFTVTNPTTEREYAACMLYCMHKAAMGRRYGPRPRPGKRHRNAVPAVPMITNTPHRSTEPSASASAPTNCQHDAEAAADAISRAWTYDREPGTPLAALAGALARSYGYRYAQHRTDRHFARVDADDLPEPIAPEERGANARAELASIVGQLSPDDRGAWDYALSCWQARPADMPPVAMRKDNALRSLRRIARRTVT